MAQQRPGGLDLSRLTTADKLILGGVGALLIWSWIPVWYSTFGKTAGAWNGATCFAAAFALLGVLLTVGRVTGMIDVHLRVPAAYVDLGLAGLSVIFILLGLAIKPFGAFKFSWGIFVGLVLALVWGYGAFMRYQEQGAGARPAAGPPPPPAQGGGGFSA